MFTCPDCGNATDVLHQSYADGSYQCATCALGGDPFINDQQRRRLERQRKADETRERRAIACRERFHTAKEATAIAG